MSDQETEVPVPSSQDEDTGTKGNEPAADVADEGSDTGQLAEDGSHRSGTEGAPVGGKR